MLFNKCSLIFVTVFICAPLQSTFGTSIITYIDEKSRETKHILAKVYSQYGKTLITNNEGSYKESWEQLWSDRLNKSQEPEKLEESLNKLKYLLEMAIYNVTEARQYRTKHNFTSNVNKPLDFEFSNVVTHVKNAPTIAFDSTNENIGPNITKVHDAIKNVELRVDEILNVSNNLLFRGNTRAFLDNVLINGNVHFDELYINNLQVKRLNQQPLEFDQVLLPETDQNFSAPLQARDIYIENLEIASICGLGSNNWVQVNDIDKTSLRDVDLNKALIHNDTIVVNKDLVILDAMNAQKINNVSLSIFTDDAFVIGKRQFVNGSVTCENLLHVAKFSAAEINDVPSSMLITKYTNQTLEEVFIDALEVDHLYADKINGVPIEKAARKSQENVIKGKVTLKDFLITDELTIQEDMILPFTRPSQNYDEVTIEGDVIVKNLEMDNNALLNLVTDNVLTDYNIHDIIENSWSKSGNQVFSNPLLFKKGASVDKLSCKYLNGLTERDFLYVSSRELADLENILFADFQFSKVINEDNRVSERKLIDQSSNVLTIHDQVHISQLSVSNVITDYYNGIPLKDIMEAGNFSKFLQPLELETVRVNDRMAVDRLKIDSFPIGNTAFHKALKVHQDLQIDLLKLNDLNVKSLIIKKLFGKYFDKALRAQSIVSKGINVPSLTIDGEVRAKTISSVDKINGKDTDDFVRNVKRLDLVDLIESEDIKNLRIKNDLNVTMLNGKTVEDYFERSLTKSARQNISGNIESLNTNVNYLKANVINEKNLSNLVYVDEPCILSANVSFSELLVQGNVKSKTFDNESTSKMLRRLEVLPLQRVKSMTVLGSVNWNKSSKTTNSITNLFTNAVTKNDNQVLSHTVTLATPVTVNSLHLQNNASTVYQQIYKTVSDSVMDYDDKEIVIKGKKTFKSQLSVDTIEIVNNFDVKKINGFDVENTMLSIFQNYDNNYKPILNNVTFLKEVEIGTLITNNKIHGVAADEIASYHNKMPDNIHFEHLTIQGNVSLHKLDGTVFDEFRNKRLTLREYHQVYSNVEFTNLVYAKNKTITSSINDVKATNIVTSDDIDHIPIVIQGEKVFHSQLTIDGNADVIRINNFELKNILSNENVLINDDNNSSDIEIFGNLVFQAGVETSNSNINVLGQINGEQNSQIFRVKPLEKTLAIESLEKNESSVDNLISNLAFNIPGTYVASTLLYLEQDDNIHLHLPGVRGVKSTQVGQTTRLDIYTAEPCESENDCQCRNRHIFEITPTNNFALRKVIEPNVLFEFYEPNGLFRLKIVSEECLYSHNDSSIANVVWVEPNTTEMQLFQVNNTISDAQIFVYDGKVYLILAIFYDKSLNSSTTNSLIYKIDARNKNVDSKQYIQTDGAKAVHVFTINNNVYVLIGCIKGRAESLLLEFLPNVREFQVVQNFATGGSKYVTSANCSNKHFVILSNPDIEALQIFVYNDFTNNFYFYQNLYFESKTTSLNVFHTKDSVGTATFIITTTKDGWLYIYEYLYFGKFQRKISYWTDIQIAVPFSYMNQNYLFAGLKSNSTVLKIIQQGLY